MALDDKIKALNVCKKCDYGDIARKYQCDKTGLGPDYILTEIIRCTCKACGYSWDAKPLVLDKVVPDGG